MIDNEQLAHLIYEEALATFPDADDDVGDEFKVAVRRLLNAQLAPMRKADKVAASLDAILGVIAPEGTPEEEIDSDMLEELEPRLRLARAAIDEYYGGEP